MPQGRKLLDIELYNRVCVGREDLHWATGSEYALVIKEVSSADISRNKTEKEFNRK